MNWSDIIISAVSIIVTGLVSWGVAKLIELINSKIGDANAKAMLTAAVTTVTDVVKQTYQTYVESLKGQDAFTEEAQKTALANALETIKSLLPEKVKTYITENFSNIDAWLTTQIEAAIYTLKNSNTSSSGATAATDTAAA